MTQHEAIGEVWEHLQQPSEGSYFFFEAEEPHQRAEARVYNCTVTHREFQLFRILLSENLEFSYPQRYSESHQSSLS